MSKRKNKAPWTVHSTVRQALRESFRFSPMRKAALARAWVGLGYWRCERPSCRLMTKRPEVDHIVAVGPTPGSRNAGPEVTWDGWLGRLFCPPEGLDVLCAACHRRKTNTEIELLTPLVKS